jgi:PAS domain S-box-containing protein
MAELRISDEWLLANVPFISFVCDNDPAHAMRFLFTGGGQAYDGKLEDLLRDKHYFAASTTHPEDVDIVDAHTKQAVAGGATVVSRYRLVQADGTSVPVLLISQAILDAEGNVQALAGVSFDLRRVPELLGPPALLSKLKKPARRRAPRRLPRDVDASIAARELPILSFFTETDANYTVRHSSGSLEELLGYSAEQFVNAKVYKPASTVLPEDQDVADAYIDRAGAAVDNRSVARMRLVNSAGDTVPVLIFARGARPEGAEAVGVAGGVLDISHVPALQGPFGLLATE